MSNKRFEELAGSLNDSEKKVLLNQINENLNSNPIDTTVNYDKVKEESEKQLEDHVTKELDSMGFFKRLFLTIRSFLVGKNPRELFIHDLLQNLERKITYTSPTIVNFKKRRFTNILISDLLRIYSLVTPFIIHFKEIWESPLALEKLIGQIISEKYSSNKDQIDQFISEAEIDKIIINGEGLEQAKKKLLKSVYDYRKKIPEHIFPETEEELLSLIALKNIILYNYTPMFKLMGITSSDSYEAITDKSVSMSLVVRYLEEFYKLLIHYSGVSLNKNSIHALIELTTSDEESEEEFLWNNYNKLSQRLKELTINYPFEDLIRYARNNPYYKIDFSLSKIDVSEFYFSTLKKEMVSDLNTLFVERERVVINDILKKMFKNFDFINFQNYKVFSDFDSKKYGLGYFKYIDILTILLNYLKYYYLRELKDILLVLSKQIFEKNHILQNRSLEISIGIDTLLERIIRFDKSLSPESESGKTMRTLFNGVVSNRQNLRMYKAFIKQKDEEVMELIKLSNKLLTDLERILDQTLKSPSDSVRLQVSAIHPSINRKVTFRDLLNDKKAALRKFIDLYNKKISFESGS